MEEGGGGGEGEMGKQSEGEMKINDCVAGAKKRGRDSPQAPNRNTGMHKREGISASWTGGSSTQQGVCLQLKAATLIPVIETQIIINVEQCVAEEGLNSKSGIMNTAEL